VSGKHVTQSQGWLAPTKLQPPRLRVELIERPQLWSRLECALSQRLTLLNAPAGFGKTTTLVQWHARLQAAGHPVGWFTFDEDDTDPLTFIAGVARSFTAASPAFGGLAEQGHAARQDGGRATDRAERRALAWLLQEIGTLVRPVLLLDDYHFVEARELQDTVMQLVRLAPQNLHVVLASRSRNLLPVSTLVVQGQVNDIGADELRLSADEVGRVFGDRLPRPALERLIERTEGWPMAVRLAHMWSRDGVDVPGMIDRFNAATGDVAGYLTEQIMRSLPGDVQRFLVGVSILDEVNGDLANVLLQRHDSWQTLASLGQLSALLTPLEGGDWFRFHPLFASYLRALARSLGEERIRELHILASSWFSQHGNLERAVRHAALAGDHVAAARLIEDAGGVWISVEHGSHRMRRLLWHLPAIVIDARPRLRAARALLYVKDGRLDDARRELDETRARGRSGADPLWDDEAERDTLITGAAVTGQGDDGVDHDVLTAIERMVGSASRTNRWMQAVLNELLCLVYLRRGNAVLAQAAGREAVRIYDECDATSGRMFSRLHLGGTLLVQGRVREAAELLSHAENIGVHGIPDDTPTLAMVRIVLAHARYECNDLVAAASLCDAALEEIEHAEGWLEIYWSGYRVASGLALARGDVDGAMRVVERGLETADRRKLRRLRNLLEWRRRDLELRAGQYSQVGDIGTTTPDLAGDEGLAFLEREVGDLSAARLAIHVGDFDRAAATLSALSTRCLEFGRGRSILQALILLAVAHRRRGSMDEAANAVRRALAIAAPEGLRRPFLDEGPEVIALLDDALKHVRVANLTPDAVALLADVFSAQLGAVGAHEGSPSHLLRPREREVLAGLKQGLSNKVIARRLDLTDDAIKYHLKKIYAKLGVSDRAMAVVVAERHGLIR
jgi:LuxR family maltose regulon positive regulatory protein